ncbi:DNA processing protein [Lachnospiraceae bacterium YSD2013]|nr:DNA processing protein [Lachnospiraceae bacterium YSD2013]
MGSFKQALLLKGEEEMPYFYFLSKTSVIGGKTYSKMQEFYASPREFYEASLDDMKKTKVFTNNQLKLIGECRERIDINREYKEALNQGIRMIPIDSEEYPRKLRYIKDAPPIVFVKGELMSKHAPTVSIIGARECSVYGANVAKRLGELFAEAGIAVISGMARGVDSIAQKAVIESGGYSLALLGGGVDVIYPKESATLYYKLLKNGGVMSEHAPGTMPRGQFFAMRNRLISGLSDVVCVVEAKAQSGTLITVDSALEQGREVYAVPGRITDITSFGTNELIRQGAGIISDLDGFVNDFVNEYSFAMASDAPTDLAKEKAPARDFLTDNEKLALKGADEDSFTADILSYKTKLPAFELLGICVSLCEKGIFKSVGAGRFVLSDKGMNLQSAI